MTDFELFLIKIAHRETSFGCFKAAASGAEIPVYCPFCNALNSMEVGPDGDELKAMCVKCGEIASKTRVSEDWERVEREIKDGDEWQKLMTNDRL